MTPRGAGASRGANVRRRSAAALLRTPFPIPLAPAAAQPGSPAAVDEALVEAYGPFAGDPMLVRRAWLTALLRERPA